jgi:DNA-binding CsgD family transcriptional regulator
MNAAEANAIEAIYGATLSPEQWPHALQAIANVSDDVGTLLVYQREDGAFGHICSPGLMQIAHEFATEYKGEDLRAKRALNRGLYFHRNVLVDRDLVTLKEMEEHPFYQLLGRHGLRHHAAVTICPNRSLATSVAVQRRIERPEFNHHELHVLERLSRHVENALRVSMRILEAELARDEYSSCLDRLGAAVLGLDHSGRLIYTNGQAQALRHELDLREGRTLGGGGGGYALRERVTAMIAAAHEGAPAAVSPVMWLSPDTGARHVAYFISHIPAQAAAGEHFTSLRHLILIKTYDPSDTMDPAIVRDVFKLTLGEARLASLIGGGIQVKAAAEVLGITEDTARTVLKRVFAKTGVGRQGELAALMMRLVVQPQ